jgi:hypothetical protein
MMTCFNRSPISGRKTPSDLEDSATSPGRPREENTPVPRPAVLGASGGLAPHAIFNASNAVAPRAADGG